MTEAGTPFGHEAGAAEVPVWEQRFRAPTIGFPRWARNAPDRLAVASNESGSWQVYAWDRASDTRRQVTDEPIGVSSGACTPDGEGVVWFHDVTGDEVGHWVIEPFPGGERQPLVPGVGDAWSAGLALGDEVVAVGTATDAGFAVHVARRGEARVLHRHGEMVEVAGLSRDGALLALEHAEHGDTIHPAVRVVDSWTGEAAGEQWDGRGLGLSAARWSPVAGDARLALVHERQGLERPAIWDVATGTRQDIGLDVPGDVSVIDWWPKADALLVLHDHEGRNQLYRYHLGTDSLLPLAHPPGTISGAGVRPDGEVWFRVANGATPPAVRSARGKEVIAPAGPRAPKGQPFRSWEFTDAEGRRLHGFVATPEGEGPHPVVMLVHGGPTWAYTDSFLPDVQAWVDHGAAVAMVNYRGSTGYGVAFRDALIGNPGLPEVADVIAGLDALVAEGVADPSHAAVAGGSWGGYVSLLAIGLHPERWAAAVAAVPVGDYLTAYRDESPGLQAFDRSLFGGSPDEVGTLYRERSPLTYVDRVRTPVLVIAGDNDSRCPIRQVLNYVDALRAHGGEVEVYRFDAGHGSMVVDERVRQMRAELAFVLPRLGLEPLQ
ncbi:MAG TPA: prolyl oligopeptidase family serine peptidase [Acidimicrobiales bacterium]|nr:prolyl oligopeptidase family serine peptidase [Acidimicrobiales bacterium]